MDGKEAKQLNNGNHVYIIYHHHFAIKLGCSALEKSLFTICGHQFKPFFSKAYKFVLHLVDSQKESLKGKSGFVLQKTPSRRYPRSCINQAA